MDNIIDKVLKAIKDQKPQARWKFRLKDYALWLAGVLSVLIGSFSVSVAIYMLVNNDWLLGQQISGTFWAFIFATLPYFWLVAILFLTVLAYYNFRHTSEGYRYQLITLTLGSVLISLFLGAVFYYIGLGQMIDESLYKNIPSYERLASPRRAIWMDVAAGRLAGQVVAIRANDFDLVDFRHRLWGVELPLSSRFIPNPT